MRVLIIGYGNPLRGDDAFGFVAAERLAKLIADPAVQVLALTQLTPELMDPISRAEQVIFIDAAVQYPASDAGSVFTHHFTPATLVAGARRLYGRAASPTVLTAAAETFELGAPMSRSVAAELERVIAEVITRAGER
jgi:hydrogenase maturation protease